MINENSRHALATSELCDLSCDFEGAGATAEPGAGADFWSREPGSVAIWTLRSEDVRVGAPCDCCDIRGHGIMSTPRERRGMMPGDKIMMTCPL